MKCYIMDAFTDKLFGGNPAGVVLIDEGRDFPRAETMRLVAAEMRYSETVFVKRIGKNAFEMRYFTPVCEVDLCGHATIAAYSALADAEWIPEKGQFINRTKAGDLNIIVNEGQVYQQTAEPKLIQEYREPSAIQSIYHALGIGNIIHQLGDKLLPEQISTGLRDIIVPVPDETILHGLTPDFELVAQVSKQCQAVGFHVFTVGKDSLFHARNFAPAYGIPEEAATGTANSALAYYLFRYGLLEVNKETVFIQGESMKRPSRIHCLVSEKQGLVQIFISGRAVIMVKGDIYLGE